MNREKRTVADVSHTICSGCMMCGDLCPQKAITYPVEQDCFWYPQVNLEKCVHCGLCYKKCPTIAQHSESGTIQGGTVCVGAKTKNEELRANSTSGGIYSEIANEWVSRGGYVCGAIYDKDNHVVHRIGNSIDFVAKTRQSKYVQSETSGIYREVRNRLALGNRVLFTGTPCQVKALYSYLGEPQSNSANLLTIDFICLGIATPVLYEKYLRYLEQKFHSKIDLVHFKDKRAGWRNIGTSIHFQNGQEYFRVGSRDTYMVSYVTDVLCMRESCHSCPYRRIHHESDLTIGDFWGIENVNPAIDDNKGLSAVLLNTEKGEILFKQVSSRIDYFETTADNIAKGNFTVLKAKKANPRRTDFLHDLHFESYKKVIRKYCSYSGYRKLLKDARYVKSFLKRKLKLMIRGK